MKKQLSLIHLSLINEVRHSSKSDLDVSTSFQHKYHLQNPNNKSSFPLQNTKIGKKQVEKFSEKSLKKRRETIRKSRWNIDSTIQMNYEIMFHEEQN